MGSPRHWRYWLVGFFLTAGTLSLLALGELGARIATVLALLVAVLGLLVARKHESPPPPLPGWLVDLLSAAVRQVQKNAHRLVRLLFVLFLMLSVVATRAFWAPPLGVLIAGCEHATELRLLTSPEQLEPVRLLADRYQHSESAQRYGCASVHLYAFALPTKQAREALAAGWPSSALREAPQPDVWLADSSREVTQVEKLRKLTGIVGTVIANNVTVTVAWSPIVLGVPAARAHELLARSSGQSWSELFEAIGLLDWDVVRPDPASSPAGESGTALLYGGRTLGDARQVEQRIELSLDRGKYPLGDSLDVLTQYRQLRPQSTAVVVSEQALARFNNGGDACDNQLNVGDRLLAFYPSDTRSLDFQFVHFAWSPPAQADAAIAFRTWLTSADGKKALADVGLRSSGHTAGCLLTPRNGVQPDTMLTHDPVPRSQAISTALEKIRPAGDTPLYRTIVNGVTGVGRSSKESSNALVVLTDGNDTTSGLTNIQLVDAVKNEGVRVFVLALGDVSCATTALSDVTTATGGRCLDINPSSSDIDAKLAGLFGVLWSKE